MNDMSLERFVKAQENPYSGYERALEEMKQGQKRGHWIWYIFPQLRGLGYSDMARYYGICGKQEARQYLQHPVLGARLREITETILLHAGQTTAEDLMNGEIDALKLRSSMTLFDSVSPDDIFADVLDIFFDGERCPRSR